MSEDFDVWREVYYAIGTQIESLVVRQDQQAVLLSIVGGASVAARGVADAYGETFPELQRPPLDRATAATAILVMPMVSRSMRSSWHGRGAQSDWDAQWSAVTKALLTILGANSPEQYEDAWALNVQFCHIRDDEERGTGSGLGWWTELEILVTLVLAALRGTDMPRVASVPVPIAGSYEIFKAGWPSLPRAWYEDIEHATQAHTSFLAAEVGMASSLRSGMTFLKRDR